MIEQLKIDFDKINESLKLSSKSLELRKQNLNQFVENGFPNKRLEDWKFSDLNQIITSNIKNLSFYNNTTQTEIDESIFIKNFKHNKIVFINGEISGVDLSYED